MKVILKFPIYVVAEFSDNVPRDKASKVLQEFYQNNLEVSSSKDGVQRHMFLRALEEQFGCKASVKFVTEKQLLQKLLTQK